MQLQRNIANIVLVGFMGTGKTSVGHELASMLNMNFIDTDDIIEQDSSRSISDIFTNMGEEHFRNLESKAVEKVSKLSQYIISTGGGVVIRDQNIQNLKSTGILFHLDAAPEVIFQRTKHETQRPLLKVDDPMGKIREMLENRAPFYAKADYRIDTSQLSVKEVAEKIVEFYKMNQIPLNPPLAKGGNRKEISENCLK